MAIPSPSRLDTPPVVLYQMKRTGYLLVGGGTVALLASAIFLVQGDGISGQFGLVSAVAGLMLLVGVLSLRRPSLLILAPEGLTYVTMFRRFSWPWSQIASFQKASVSVRSTRADVIRFYLITSATYPHTLPAYWELPLDEVVSLLNSACRKWGD